VERKRVSLHFLHFHNMASHLVNARIVTSSMEIIISFLRSENTSESIKTTCKNGLPTQQCWMMIKLLSSLIQRCMEIISTSYFTNRPQDSSFRFYILYFPLAMNACTIIANLQMYQSVNSSIPPHEYVLKLQTDHNVRKLN
jgi:hypothetical protein